MFLAGAPVQLEPGSRFIAFTASDGSYKGARSPLLPPELPLEILLECGKRLSNDQFQTGLSLREKSLEKPLWGLPCWLAQQIVILLIHRVAHMLLLLEVEVPHFTCQSEDYSQIVCFSLSTLQ